MIAHACRYSYLSWQNDLSRCDR